MKDASLNFGPRSAVLRKKSDQGGIERYSYRDGISLGGAKKSDQGGIERKLSHAADTAFTGRNQTKVGLKV